MRIPRSEHLAKLLKLTRPVERREVIPLILLLPDSRVERPGLFNYGTTATHLTHIGPSFLAWRFRTGKPTIAMVTSQLLDRVGRLRKLEIVSDIGAQYKNPSISGRSLRKVCVFPIQPTHQSKPACPHLGLSSLSDRCTRNTPSGRATAT